MIERSPARSMKNPRVERLRDFLAAVFGRRLVGLLILVVLFVVVGQLGRVFG